MQGKTSLTHIKRVERREESEEQGQKSNIDPAITYGTIKKAKRTWQNKAGEAEGRGEMGNGEGGIHHGGIRDYFCKGNECTQREENGFSFDYTYINLLFREWTLILK